MKKLKSFFVLMIITVTGYCQQLPLISHTYLNPLLYNPALTGLPNNGQLFLFHRDQWNLLGGPVTNGLTADNGFKDGKVGLGISLFNQKTGISEINKLNVHYAYHLKISEISNLHFGVSPGLVQTKVNYAKAIVTDSNDPMLSSQVESNFSANIDAGVAYDITDFQVGLGINQAQGTLLENNLQLKRQFLGNAKYIFKIGEEKDIQLIPLIITKVSGGVPLQLDMNLTMAWKDMFWIGGTYRKANAIGANAAVKVKKFRVGYCFESSKMGSYTGITNEISLGYVFNTYKQSKPSEDAPVKGNVKENDKEELERLKAELSDKEDALIDHEKEIYALIDQLYTKANQDEFLTIQQKLDKLEKTQKEVNRIKQELREYNNEKNVEIYKLRKQIDSLQKK